MFRIKRHPITKKIFKVLLEKKFEGAWINEIIRQEDTITVNLHLPEHKEIADLEKILNNLKEEISAADVKLGKKTGKAVKILFGMRKLDTLVFSESMLREHTLQVTFPSAYGEYILDFEDGATCHLLNGGTTRMGKTCFLLYLSTCIFLQNYGKVKLFISSAKLKDYFPFEGIQQVQLEKDEFGMDKMLQKVIKEYKRRDKLLYSPQLRKATDAKSVRELYPEHYHEFEPIFLIIDEYARFAEFAHIQKAVTELVETAGFVNVHVIIASQRPDAGTVLRPRIRANLLCRMAFTTADKKNSEIILDKEGAEKLGKIAGRGLLLDSELHTIQVPYLTAKKCDELLEPYRSVIDAERTRCENSEATEAIPCPVEGSTGEIVFLPQQESSGSCEQSDEKTESGRESDSCTQTEGIVLPIYAEPNYDSPKLNQD
jgi:hypothetical protein